MLLNVFKWTLEQILLWFKLLLLLLLPGCSKTIYFKADLEMQQLIEAFHVGKTSNNIEIATISLDSSPRL